ncbi:hypothetical protein [uncultured Sphingomonas sp.]|uniref:hypothetical protein n=1 Tax=uncultured Sphingomonas sp. TaxID=158754 RepID=UPI002598AEB5|nr:hypothetical protein [uncultured Sphingomonas sp.]
MTIHLTVSFGGGWDWPATVSAGAAVVQAVGAVAAIWYSGKLARDAARREIAAADASRAREEEADRRAEARIAAENEASMRRRQEDDRRRYNEPIFAALDLATAARSSFEEAHTRILDLAERGSTNHAFCNPTIPQNLFQEQRSSLVDRAPDSRVATLITELAQALEPYRQGVPLRPREWVAPLEMKIAAADEAMKSLRECLRA